MWLIVGLGNPGQKYQATRHNLGFRLADKLAERAGIKISRKRARALVGRGRWAGQEIILAKPQTFMNLSGLSVAELVKGLKVELGALVVAHDDLDLPLGRLRLGVGYGPGGHKGVDSIIAELGGSEFVRLRLGIGRPENREMDPADYVLRPFGSGEVEMVEEVLARGVEAIWALLTEGLNKAQSQFNSPLGVDNSI